MLAVGETPTADDMNACLDALDVVLQELPVHGYVWPALTAEASLTWVSGNTVTPPTDYYAHPVLWSSYSGSRVQLRNMTHAEWNSLPNTAPSGVPSAFYINPAGTWYLYPSPTANPVLTLQYQRLVADSVQTTAPAMPRSFFSALGYGVANEMLLKFGVPPDIAQQIQQRWMEKREYAMQSAISSAPISFVVYE